MGIVLTLQPIFSGGKFTALRSYSSTPSFQAQLCIFLMVFV